MRKEEQTMEERVRLLEKEIQTLTAELQRFSSQLESLDEMRLEMRAIKVFLGRKYPEFKNELPEIVKKIKENIREE